MDGAREAGDSGTHASGVLRLAREKARQRRAYRCRPFRGLQRPNSSAEPLPKILLVRITQDYTDAPDQFPKAIRTVKVGPPVRFTGAIVFAT